MGREKNFEVRGKQHKDKSMLKGEKRRVREREQKNVAPKERFQIEQTNARSNFKHVKKNGKTKVKETERGVTQGKF